ncbi:BBP7 family outer membrane beta-barrel protein [Roseimaritima ulvae]|uniref:Uncharacterized protein n=1 Tax=Roseimaritima ulvae TaxID=980254 RepID=A0A5B9R9G7_9BACT|nr:BBP7 family outer membrane beta-barrel protein [Roseimaritima ulvae]QEG43641.1 hypothetical protein UC8_56930 [Roseimaritima ulvae]
MKRIFRALTMAATIAGFSATAANAQQTMRAGDLPTSAGATTSGYSSTQSIGDSLYTVDPALYGNGQIQPAGHRSSTRGLRSRIGSQACGDCYSDSCQGGCKPTRRSSLADGDCNEDTWLRAELLLWFPQARRSPVLAATNALPGGLPVVGQAGYTPQFGGEIGTGLETGFRADVGKYFADGQLGLGARLWFLSDAEEGYSASSNGDVGLGLPIFDTQFGGESAVLAAFDDGVNPELNGSLSIDTELSIASSEFYARLLFAQGKDYRVDMIGGYSYFNIEDDLQLNLNAVRVARPADGLTRNFSDHFNTTNNFHGGQIGFENLVTRGRFSIRTLTKVHLGNMSQRVEIDGSSQRFFAGGPAPEQFDGGILAMDNQGVQRRDVFAFAPEANFKLNYRMRNYVNFSVGYTFIYWNHVALAGDQIDRNVDTSGLLSNAGTVASPSRKFEDRGFFVQGIDLGVSVDY